MTSSTGGLVHEVKRAVASGRLVVILVVLGTLAGVTLALMKIGDATDKATAATARADRAAACSQLLLGSIADRALRPEAVERQCDTEIATDIIARSLERDRQAKAAEAKAAQAQRERDLLRGQLLALGEQPATDKPSPAASSPPVTVVVPGAPVPAAGPSASPSPRPAPTRPPTASPTAPPPTPGGLPGLLCSLIPC